MIELGDKGKDRISGFTGIITAIAHYLHGCTRCSIAPQEIREGKVIDHIWIDEGQVEIIEKQAYKHHLAKTTTMGPGGQRSDPPDR
jgi:hypothetical protein